MQISGMRGPVSVTAGTLRHHLQPGDRSGRDRQPQRDARVPSPLWNRAPLGNRDPPEMGTAGGKGAFPRAAGGSRGSELGVNIQTWRGTPYHGILALGEVNEIRLLPPTVLLPLIEAIRQDHAALALEESTLGERKHKRAVNSSLRQPAREDGPPSPLAPSRGSPKLPRGVHKRHHQHCDERRASPATTFSVLLF